MATALFNSIFRRAPSTSTPPPPFPYPLDRNPYTSRTSWPPDFTQLSQKHQFRLERRYRRRSKLKYARPTWNKVLKLTQWGAIGFVVVYGVFFLEIEDVVPGVRGKDGREVRLRRKTVFDGAREWWDDKLGRELREARGRPVQSQDGKG